MTITDAISLVLSLFLIFKGFSRGFLASLIGPLALIIGTVAAIIYYAWTKNFTLSLIIGLVGPLMLAWVFHFFVNSWSKVNNPEGKIKIISRLSGALLTLIYGLSMWGIAILLLGIVPSINKPLQKMYTDIHTSLTYHILKPLDIYAIDKPSSEEDLQSLAQDKRIQEIMNDPQVIKAAQERNYSQLLSNPKIIALTQDPKLVKRMMAVYQKMSQEQK